MIFGHGGIKVEDGEKFGLSLRFAAHAFQTPLNLIVFKSPWDFFNSLLVPAPFAAVTAVRVD